MIGLTNPKSHLALVSFLDQFEKATRAVSSGSATILVCFRNTKHIEASGGIYLLARTELIVRMHPKVQFKISKPPKIPHGSLKAAKSIVHDVLCQIGYYKALRLASTRGPSLPHVECWQVLTATKVESKVLGEAIDKLTPLGVNGTLLYRAGIEALSNAAEHAYSDLDGVSRTFREKRWWLFTAVLNNELIVYVCDLGHGIPVTLPFTQEPNVLKEAMKRVISRLPPQAKKVLSIREGDALQIATSTLIKETRTSLTYRGKGGNDIKSFIDSNPSAEVRIYSNRGYWRYKNMPSQSRKSEIGMGYNNKRSINGTIVGWAVPVSPDAF